MLTITPTTENKHIMIQKGKNVEKINCCRVFDFRDSITRIKSYTNISFYNHIWNVQKAYSS